MSKQTQAEKEREEAEQAEKEAQARYEREEAEKEARAVKAAHKAEKAKDAKEGEPADKDALPEVPQRFYTGGATAQERDEWLKANRPDLLPETANQPEQPEGSVPPVEADKAEPRDRLRDSLRPGKGDLPDDYEAPHGR